MGRISTAAKSASKKTAGALGRGTGRVIKNTVKSGYDARVRRDKRRAGK